MKTKLLIISIVIALCLSATPVVAAPHGAADSGGTAMISREPGYGLGPGGEFTIYDDPDDPGSLLLSNANYHVDAKGVNGAESFQTFCVERFEDIINPMEVWVSTENAALTDPGSHAYEGGIPGFDGDDLDPMTAYLYTRFATGDLALIGYDYDETATRFASAQALQNVIWGIEEELVGWTPAAGLETTFYNAALACGWDDIHNVRILQMTIGSIDLAQDQLYYIPVPAAVLLGILGLGVAGLKLRKYA